MFSTRSIFLALILGTVAPAAIAEEAAPEQGGRAARFLRHRAHHRHMRMHLRQMRARRFFQAMQFSDAQKTLLAEKARAAAPVVAEARAAARRLVQEARQAVQAGGDRAALRKETAAKVKDLREKAFARIEPLAREAVASLTPEQRSRIEEGARKRGLTVDEAKLTRLFARVIASRRLAAA